MRAVLSRHFALFSCTLFYCLFFYFPVTVLSSSNVPCSFVSSLGILAFFCCLSCSPHPPSHSLVLFSFLPPSSLFSLCSSFFLSYGLSLFVHRGLASLLLHLRHPFFPASASKREVRLVQPFLYSSPAHRHPHRPASAHSDISPVYHILRTAGRLSAVTTHSLYVDIDSIKAYIPTNILLKKKDYQST